MYITYMRAGRARVNKNLRSSVRGGNFCFEKRLLDGRGRRNVYWSYSMTIIVLPSGVVMVPL